MRYLGGKSRIASKLALAINEVRTGILYEPFCGGLSATVALKPEYASDLHRPLINTLLAFRGGWLPPEHISEDEYKAAKLLPPEDPLHGFCGFALSFGGKWYGGYAREGKRGERNFSRDGIRSIQRKLAAISDTYLTCHDYRETPASPGDTIYCDPPYRGTTRFSGTEAFDHDTFWAWCRDKAACGINVLVSEYTAPDDVSVLKEFPSRIDLQTSDSRSPLTTEKLFWVR